MLNSLRAKSLRVEDVVQEWQTVIPKAQGKREILYTAFVHHLEELDIPNVELTERSVKTNGGKMDFIVVENSHLRNYDMYLTTREYGNQLIVSWYVIKEKPSFSRSLKLYPVRTVLLAPILIFLTMFSWFASFASGLGGSGGSGMNTSTLSLAFVENFSLYDEQEIHAYISTVHSAVKVGVDTMMKGLNLDFTKVDTKTRGFLNIS